MLSDPISFHYMDEATKPNHVRTGLANGVGTFFYQHASDGIEQTVTVKQNSTLRRKRREVRVARQKVALNALTATNEVVGASVYLVIDEPNAGFNDTELNDMVCGLTEFLTGAPPEDTTVVLRILNGEV